MRRPYRALLRRAPAVAVKGCEALESVDLPEGLILALEKPFGTDEASAASFNELLRRLVPEDQVYRIDHFLGRSTVLNILGLRFANRVFEPVWSNEHIESVSIRYDEKLGLEGRAGYYDTAGALVDMIQSHLLQVLAIVGMDPPVLLDPSTSVTRRPMCLGLPRCGTTIPSRTRGGPATRRAPSRAESSPTTRRSRVSTLRRGTETLAEVTFAIETARWAGVPFTIRSGKGLAEKYSEIVLRFKQVSHIPRGFDGSTQPSVLRLSLGPDRMALELNLNAPGEPFHLERASLETELTAVAAAPTPRCSKASSTATRPSRCAAIRRSGAGTSSSRSSTPGSAMRCPSRSTRRDPQAPSTGLRCEGGCRAVGPGNPGRRAE